MKRIVSMLMVMLMAMTLSVTAFAAEEESSKLQNSLIDSDDEDISVDQIKDSVGARATAPDVSSVEIWDYGFINEEMYPNRAGHFGVIVKIMGYGYKYAYFDGERLGLSIDSEGILTANNVAVGWYELYDCGVLVPGAHEFEIVVQSYNSATNRKTAGLTFTYNPNGEENNE